MFGIGFFVVVVDGNGREKKGTEGNNHGERHRLGAINTLVG
jgi:hypothetical protein